MVSLAQSWGKSCPRGRCCNQFTISLCERTKGPGLLPPLFLLLLLLPGNSITSLQCKSFLFTPGSRAIVQQGREYGGCQAHRDLKVQQLPSSTTPPTSTSLPAPLAPSPCRRGLGVGLVQGATDPPQFSIPCYGQVEEGEIMKLVRGEKSHCRSAGLSSLEPSWGKRACSQPGL